MIDLNDFLYITSYFRFRLDYFQGSGGNISVKIDDHMMIIKSSGISIDNITNINGYSIVNYKKTLETLRNKDFLILDTKELLESFSINNSVPSMETFFHSFTKKYTLHLHPFVVNLISVRKNSAYIFKSLFKDSIVIEYATPGYDLSRIIYDKYDEISSFSTGVIFLNNHGIIVTSNSIEDLIISFNNVIEKLENFLSFDSHKYKNIDTIKILIERYNVNAIVQLFEDHEISNICNRHELYTGTTPDSVIFLGEKILVIENIKDIETKLKFHNENYGFPKVIIIDKFIYILGQNTIKCNDIQNLLIQNKLIFQFNNLDTIELISLNDQNELKNLSIEKYRYNLNGESK